MEGYAGAFNNRNRSNGPSQQPECVRFVMKQALGRSWRHLANERINDTKPNIPLGKRFWPLSRKEETAIKRLFEQVEVRRLATLLRSRDDDSLVEVVDAAYWLKGCSSLGRLRFAVLLRVSDERLGRNELCLIDIKEATKAAAPRYAHSQMPRDNALRVVVGAQHLAPVLGSACWQRASTIVPSSFVSCCLKT